MSIHREDASSPNPKSKAESGREGTMPTLWPHLQVVRDVKSRRVAYPIHDAVTRGPVWAVKWAEGTGYEDSDLPLR